MASLRWAVLLVATFGSLADAASAARIVSWDSNPQALLISYQDVWGEFANQDPTPLIRIYGDGRVVVHYPVYTPKAGQYELRLQPAELEALILSLLEKGLASYEPKSVEHLKELEELRRREAMLDAGQLPELFMVADDSTSVFELHLTEYRPVDTEYAGGEVHRTISWLGLGTDAERYPEMEPIQQLRAAELELRALLERNDLWKVR